MGFTRRFLALLLLVLVALPCFAADEPVRARPRRAGGARVAVSSDTVGVGFFAASADPNKVHVGGVWDFDTPAYADDISGTDSSQFWTFLHAPNSFDATQLPTPAQRPFWYYDWGNNINAGDHNLWMSRVGQRVFRRTGLAGVWHVDDLSTVPDTGAVSPGFSHNITGSGSAWCGLRLNGDPNAPHDPYTGNAYTSDLQYNDFRVSPSTRSGYPGYAGQWDQLLYRDFPYDSGSPGTVSFDYRAELNNAPPGGDPNGSGWFTPDPFSPSNFVSGVGSTEPTDSFEVWVGAPREAAIYDSAHRYLSDTIDFSLGGADAPKMIFALTGVTSGSASPAIPGGASWSTVRVVLRVKTNRALDDRVPSSSGVGWNSTTGAIVVDNMNVHGTLSDFETAGQILPRFTWTPLGGAEANVTENAPASSWITTGRQAAHYGHVHNLGSLPFDVVSDYCDMAGNIAVQSNHGDPNHDFVGESQNYMISPTICLTGPRAANQGIPATLRTEASYVRIVFDFYSGYDHYQETASSFQYLVRYMGSSSPQLEGPKQAAWSPFRTFNGELFGFYDSTCVTFESLPSDWSGLIPLAATDSLQVAFQNQLRCARFGVPKCGQVDGYYFDNIQVQFVRDQPFTGVEPVGSQLDFVRGAYPNPSADGSATVLFSLRLGGPVSIRFYDLRGALVHEARISGTAGENRYRWDGVSDHGTAVGSGIYFYRLFADGVEFRNNQQRVVFVGRRED